MLDRMLTGKSFSMEKDVQWERRNCQILSDKGEVIFEKDVIAPNFWSDNAVKVVSSKYMRENESSVKQVIERVVNQIAKWGELENYFETREEEETFRHELTYILINQIASFNSPVWFNVGVDEHPQASACFINAIDDTIDSIMDLATVEAKLFKGGSGSGTNFSKLRSSKEKLSTGGRASGPVSFMRGFDSFAGVIKSGGKTRRAAKMVILNADHPDILEFIDCKVHEEKKAWALIESGYGGDINGEAYSSVFFQNSNNSVRVTDEFMNAVIDGRTYYTKAVLDGRPLDELKARDVLWKISEATHACGDPGMQFDTVINEWNTCKASGRINSSNPCSEYMFLDNSACNLASINLMKFINEDGDFNVKMFTHVVNIMIIAQDIIVDNAKYPTDTIAQNSHDYRPLGIGYANLGALLMSLGIPYDSDKGRNLASLITSIMTGQAYLTSAMLAKKLIKFAHYKENEEHMLNVIDKHKTLLDKLYEYKGLLKEAKSIWGIARWIGNGFGFRNAQVSVLAPTGTIAFMMDCDTTGIEPDIALVKYKNLVGGGVLKIVNQSVPKALKSLGYESTEIKRIVDYINETGTIEGAPDLSKEHLPVFDCAFKAEAGTRTINPMGHIKMMAATQPFISGAISKTVNVPNDATVQDIYDIYVEAWKRGLKAIAIYRDGSKRTQPLSTQEKADKVQQKRVNSPEITRRRLPDERRSITHKFDISGYEGYLTVGMFNNGKPGELFISMSKEGSVISGLMDSFATAISIALQYNVPIKSLISKFKDTKFEPSGITRNPEIPIAKSIMDYIFRWMELKFEQEGTEHTDKDKDKQFTEHSDAPLCSECGSITVRSGTCHLCLNCGSTSGCS